MPDSPEQLSLFDVPPEPQPMPQPSAPAPVTPTPLGEGGDLERDDPGRPGAQPLRLDADTRQPAR
jgi:hypothetical protein